MSSGKNFIYEFIVEQELIDEYGHVNNANYLMLFEKARWSILESSGMGYDTIRKIKTGPVVLEVTVRFSKELLPNQKNIIETTCRRKNDLIFFFDQKMINEKGEIASKAVFTAALFDLEKRKMVKPDDKWLKLFGF